MAWVIAKKDEPAYWVGEDLYFSRLASEAVWFSREVDAWRVAYHLRAVTEVLQVNEDTGEVPSWSQLDGAVKRMPR